MELKLEFFAEPYNTISALILELLPLCIGMLNRRIETTGVEGRANDIRAGDAPLEAFTARENCFAAAAFASDFARIAAAASACGEREKTMDDAAKGVSIVVLPVLAFGIRVPT